LKRDCKRVRSAHRCARGVSRRVTAKETGVLSAHKETARGAPTDEPGGNVENEERPAGPLPDEPVAELRRVPIRENGEPLVDLGELTPKLYWAPRHPVFEYRRYRLGRKRVVEMLAAAAERLPAGLRLAVVECWRPPAIQEAMHAATRERLRAEHPDWPEARLEREADRFSAPMDEHAPPPHTTGGAADVHLIDGAANVLDFTGPYALTDPAGAPAFAEGLSPEAERNRALLREVMGAAGFTNYPAEWWHWSYGDQGWAYRGGHPHALYGAVNPEGLEDADFSFRVRETPGWD
jgi:zinc D-Ala-D-Ala dipeptidase